MEPERYADPDRLRVSEREEAVAPLGGATAEGPLTLDEYRERRW